MDPGFPLGGSQFYITYNPVAFGTNAFLDGNAEFMETVGGMTGIPATEFDASPFGFFAYYDIFTAQNTPTRLSFACLLYTSPSPRDRQKSRMPSSA